jgi:serine/threonine protein kinase
MATPDKPPPPTPLVEETLTSPPAPAPAPAQSGVNTDEPAVFAQPTITPTGSPPVFAAPPSLVGQNIGDFEILEEIGRGGMGVVYKARQVSLDRLVAVKMLLGDHFHNPALRTRFLAEARAAASLAHPNIVNVYQVGDCFAGRYFVMELIAGQSLEALIKDRAVPITWAVSLLIPVAEAVHYAHTKGIVHRDLKPANIMIDQFRRPVVMDFGIAKFVGKPSSLTQQGAVMGTPAYMPPEQAGEDISQVGPHSDVYSLGAILYTLLTGKLPYDAGSAFHTILKVISAELPPAVRQLRPEVPVELERICMKSLSKAAADRQASAQAFADELRRFRTRATPQQAGSSTVRATQPSVLLLSRATKKVFRIFIGTTVIGRSSECDVILKAADISKRHCQITLDGDQLTVEDLDSANGTCVNQQPIKRAPLKDGDELDIGGHLFQIRVQKPQ